MTNDLPKLKLLTISRAYGTGAGGMERLSYELINELKKSEGVDVATLIHTGGRSTSPLFALTCIPQAFQLARQVDVVHLGDPMLALAGWLIKTFLHKPVAVHVHGLDVTYRNPLYRLYLRLFFRHLSAYFPISQAAKQALERWWVTGAITILSPGIHDVWYDPSRKREELTQLIPAVPLDSVLLLTTGRLVKRKGHAWFVEHVLPKLPARVHYLIVGNGPERGAIVAAAAQSGVTERVHLLGRVDHDSLKLLYNTVDAFIQPNIPVPNDMEGFGLVLLEAASAGRPVFAAAIDGIPDAIHDGKNGRLLPTQNTDTWVNAMLVFTGDDAAHKQIEEQSRQRTIDSYVWPKLILNYRRALDRLFN